MCNLHDPAAGLVALGAPMRLFAARANVWRVVACPYGLLSRLAEESGIGAQTLQGAGTYCGAANAQSIEDGFKLGDIMTMSPGHDDRQRGTTLVHQEHTLGPIFPPGLSGRVRRTLAPIAIVPPHYSCFFSTYSICFKRQKISLQQQTSWLQTRTDKDVFVCIHGTLHTVFFFKYSPSTLAEYLCQRTITV